MSLDTWLIYLLAATGLSLSPGPNGLLALTHGALHGRRKALYTICGGALGFVVVIALSMFGIGALLQSLAGLADGAEVAGRCLPGVAGHPGVALAADRAGAVGRRGAARRRVDVPPGRAVGADQPEGAAVLCRLPAAVHRPGAQPGAAVRHHGRHLRAGGGGHRAADRAAWRSASARGCGASAGASTRPAAACSWPSAWRCRCVPDARADESARTRILFDTDPGIDDAMALLMLARDARAELVGISTVFGNAPVDITTANALALCHRFGIEVPVARGAARPLAREPRHFPVHIHGQDGLGDVEPRPPHDRRRSAVGRGPLHLRHGAPPRRRADAGGGGPADQPGAGAGARPRAAAPGAARGGDGRRLRHAGPRRQRHAGGRGQCAIATRMRPTRCSAPPGR